MKKYINIIFLFTVVFILISCDLKGRTYKDGDDLVKEDPNIPSSESPLDFTQEDNNYTFSLSGGKNTVKKSYIVTIKTNEDDTPKGIESTINKRQGNPLSYMGVILYKDTSQAVSFLTVLINSNGNVKIGKAEMGEYKAIRDLFESANLNKGLNRENKIKVVPKDNNGNFELYINDKKECDFEYLLADYSGKSFGIIAVGDGSGNEENICYNFDIEK